MCRSYGEQFEILIKDKDDIHSYFKKQLDSKVAQVSELNDRLIGLQQIKNGEKEVLEMEFVNYKAKSRSEIEKLENENILLSQSEDKLS